MYLQTTQLVVTFLSKKKKKKKRKKKLLVTSILLPNFSCSWELWHSCIDLYWEFWRSCLDLYFSSNKIPIYHNRSISSPFFSPFRWKWDWVKRRIFCIKTSYGLARIWNYFCSLFVKKCFSSNRNSKIDRKGSVVFIYDESHGFYYSYQL